MSKIPSKTARVTARLASEVKALQEEIDTLIVEDEAAARTKFDDLLVKRRALADAQALPDVYDCLQCGGEFGDGEGADFLAAAVVTYGPDKRPDLWLDYGIQDAQRIRFCGACRASWPKPIKEYLTE